MDLTDLKLIIADITPIEILKTANLEQGPLGAHMSEQLIQVEISLIQIG
jgi:hypothetical protein